MKRVEIIITDWTWVVSLLYYRGVIGYNSRGRILHLFL